MDFSEFLKLTTNLKNAELPGLEAQYKLAPKIRKKFTQEDFKKVIPKKAGVLVLIFPDKDNEANLLLTKRATYKGNHSAQISFPGGKVEEGDVSIVETALREANEEIGINVESVKVIKKVTKSYIPPSNFMVTPTLGYVTLMPQFKINYEVAEIISISLKDLLDDDKQIKKVMSTSYMENIEVPCYQFKGHIVWGATAMILSEIKELLKQSIPK